MFPGSYDLDVWVGIAVSPMLAYLSVLLVFDDVELKIIVRHDFPSGIRVRRLDDFWIAAFRLQPWEVTATVIVLTVIAPILVP